MASFEDFVTPAAPASSPSLRIEPGVQRARDAEADRLKRGEQTGYPGFVPTSAVIAGSNATAAAGGAPATPVSFSDFATTPEVPSISQFKELFSSFGEPVSAPEGPKTAGLLRPRAGEEPPPRTQTFAETPGGAVTARTQEPGKRPGRQAVSPGEFAGTVLGTAAQVSDMFTSVGKQVLGAAPYWGARTAASLGGASAQEAAQAAQATKDWFFPPEISTPWAKVAERLGPAAQKAYNNNPVAWIFGRVGEVVESGAEKAATDNGLQKEDFLALADQLMGSLLWRQVRPGVQKAFQAKVEEARGDGGTFAGRGPRPQLPGPEAPRGETYEGTATRVEEPAPASFQDFTPRQLSAPRPLTLDDPIIANMPTPPSEGRTVTKGELSASKQGLIDILGASMYSTSIGSTAIKELFQNSFDATKGALHKGEIKAGKIDIEMDPETRVISIRDNGTGMTKDTVQKAFFTIAGTDKGDLPPELRSGGFGLAKMAFMLGSKDLALETVRNGRKITVKATADDIRNDNFEIVEEPTTQPNGTQVKVTIPKGFNDPRSGEFKDIHMPWGAESIPALKGPLMGNAEVTWNGEKLPIGKHQDMKDRPFFTKARFNWGEADIYFGTERKEHPSHRVLSSGIYQFDKRVPSKSNGWEPIPYDIVVDIRPKVTAHDIDYPFNNSREDFRSQMKEDVEALQDYLRRVASGYAAEGVKQSFKAFKQMDRAEVGARTRQGKLLPQEKLSAQDEAAAAKRFQDMLEAMKDIEIAGGQAKTAGGQVVGQSEKMRPKSFSADKKLAAREDMMVDMAGVDPERPIYHNNTNVDWTREYPGSDLFFAKVGTVLVDLLKDATQLSEMYGLADTANFAGVSLDKTYRGVKVKVPYEGFFVNPLATRAKTIHGAAEGILHTMLHEIAHGGVMSHGDDFVSLLGTLNEMIADTGALARHRTALQKILDQHSELYTEMRRVYDRSSTKNVAQSLEGQQQPGGADAGGSGNVPPAEPGAGGRAGGEGVPGAGGLRASLPGWAATLGISAAAYAAAKQQGQDAVDGLVLAAAFALKPKGGMWHPKAVEVLSNPLAAALDRRAIREGMLLTRLAIEELKQPDRAWAQRAASTYLNKHMGTETDPLRDVEIPFGEGTKKWGEVTGELVKSRTVEEIDQSGYFNDLGLPQDSRAKLANEPIWNLENLTDAFYQTPQNAPVYRAAAALKSYLSHVGDYLRENVPADKLPQYDLVRAVKETAKLDAEMARKMEEEAAASQKDLSVYKDYEDGFKWVELKIPEKLTEVQAQRVQPVSKAVRQFDYESARIGHEPNYVAVDNEGKAIASSYTGRRATGKTPEEAHFAGQVTSEGNLMGHSVSGYAHEGEYGQGGLQAVRDGAVQLYSLRDAKGKSHVTVEVEPEKGDPAYWLSGDVMNRLAGHNVFKDWQQAQAAGYPGDMHAWFKENYPGAFEQSKAANILQIKGKQNRAPAAEYLPYVQDFVKSGKWGEVGDLEGTGLVDWQHRLANYLAAENGGHVAGHVLSPAIKAARKHFGESNYVTEEEWKNYTQGGPPSQRGSVDPKLLVRLAAAGAGAALGAYLMRDNPLWGSVLGGVGAAMLTRVSPSGVLAAVRRAMQPGKLVKIDNLAREVQYDVKAARRASWQVTQKVVELVPREADRVAVRRFLEGDISVKLNPAQQQAAGLLRQAWSARGLEGLSKGVLHDLRYNYVTHVWGDKTGRTVWDEIFNRPGGAGTSEHTPFSMRRVYATIEEGKAKGLVPLTEDPVLLFEIYANSLARAIANKKMISALKSTVVDGKGLVVPLGRSPAGYERIDHPQMQAFGVHPDIAPMMRFIFDQNNSSVIVKGLEAVSTIQKRIAVSASLFHAKALEDAMLGAKKFVAAPWTAARTAAQGLLPSVFGRDSFLKQIRDGGPGDLVDRGMKAGLQFSLERQGAALEELNSGWYQGMKAGERFLDETLPGLGLPVKGFEKLSHAMDSFMWGRLHAAMKLNIFAEKSAQLTVNDARSAVKENRPAKSQAELDRIAAAFANDIFGGLNWQELVMNFNSRWGREFAQALFGPSGRRAMRILMFAPDWTLSTTRAFVQAFGPGSGVRGLLRPETLADLHRQYILRSIFWYALIGDAMNLYFSGHHLWQNENKTRIDLGDGRTMQWSKHFMEPFHWLLEPTKQGLNKLGVVPKEALNQIFHTEYLNPGKGLNGAVQAGPEMQGTRLGHVARQFAPISGQQYAGGDLTSAVSGFVGAPIYGKTTAVREQEKLDRKLQRSLRKLEGR